MRRPPRCGPNYVAIAALFLLILAGGTLLFGFVEPAALRSVLGTGR